MADSWQSPLRLVLTRRRLLQLLAGTGVLAVQPRLLARLAAPARSGSYGFLTADELATLDAVTALILPTDQRPGAREIGVVDYIQSLLSFLPGSDANCDQLVTAADLTAIAAHAPGAGCTGGDVDGDGAVDARDAQAGASAVYGARPAFGGGPFSGRQAQPHFDIGDTPCGECHGAKGDGGHAVPAPGGGVDAYPPNAFRLFPPMNRLQELSWKVRILGPQAAPQVADNPLLAQLPEVDLRQRYRSGLAQLESLAEGRFGTGFAALTAVQQGQVLTQANRQFAELLNRHVIEGILCAPEYGGNRDRVGWQLAGYDGDSQPLGYAIYDESAPGSYRERPDKPNSGPNPDEDCAGFSAAMQSFLDLISRSAGGGPFADPYCFEVDR
ncbi:MAG TPA: gluconate 2-dehydrogenase subunit 3 family protein [Candidatus Dormibacteraeota bacterium]|nr:gluconate 2-dehydrogenase subunit 3 family protein [Candidatus Dormibacteraeota bacterium]